MIDKVSIWDLCDDPLWISEWRYDNNKCKRDVQHEKIPRFFFKSPAIFSPAGAAGIS